MTKVLTVKCPKCGHLQKYIPKNFEDFSQKKKRCVYCGHSFLIHKQVNESRIVSVEKI